MVQTALIQKQFDIFNSWNYSAVLFSGLVLGPFTLGSLFKGFKPTKEQRTTFHLVQMRSSQTEKLNVVCWPQVHRRAKQNFGTMQFKCL